MKEIKRKFKVSRAEVGSWSTSFSIKDMDHSNSDNSMSPEAFIHHLGGLCGRQLGAIQGMEFEVIFSCEIKEKSDDPLNLCGKTLSATREL